MEKVQQRDLEALLRAYKEGTIGLSEVMKRLDKLPYEDIGFANIDHHRSVRSGVPEVIYGAGKTAEQILGIARQMRAYGENVLITRVDPEKAHRILADLGGEYHEVARTLRIECVPPVSRGGRVAVITAGTSDDAVASEAVETLRALGYAPDRINDVGVAGLHRLLARRERLAAADVLIVIAGMEGALASVVAGLVRTPVIAVPTSVGYGANFGGLSALLAMLSSCASGIGVVNIDNGFGAAMLAHRMLDRLTRLCENNACDPMDI